jgi:hypothetical protein
MNLHQYAKVWVKSRGLLDKDSDYDGMLGQAILELIDIFRTQRHSGYSANLVKEMFYRLLNDYDSGQEADYKKAKPKERKE